MSVTQLRHTRDARFQAAEEIGLSLNAFELALSEAFAKGGELAMTMSVARTAAGLSPIAGQPAFAQIAAALNSLAQAMEQTAAGHYTLNQTRKDLRIPVTSLGDSVAVP
ncbi:hypothetical protein [Sphingomonas quercus]|uniref:Methyl-accepting chemotaxis protein n=1 Tax=Sphingomonas quercus TaxID=2842451 RepID=A0ABS6BG56_9SPHN|nr:hypothetical protein [Sphingomonas quercus]MBU3077283.1 hypothetical protein [Sphingomonas quercus]